MSYERDCIFCLEDLEDIVRQTRNTLSEADLDRLDGLRADLFVRGEDVLSAPLSHLLAVGTRLLRIKVVKETLYDLAREFDEAADLNTRIAVAERMRFLLREDYEEFDRLFEDLMTRKPDCLTPAATVLNALDEAVAAREPRR